MNRITYGKVEGAPHQPGQRVRVVAAVDVEVHDVTEHIGKVGTVRYLDFTPTVAQTFPNDPLICLLLEDANLTKEVFWKEELEAW